jgi:phenylalanyl-tRNA synthetase beta chain
MRVPVEWLREYVDFVEPLETVAEKMTMAGMEIGEIAEERFGAENSFVGEVVKVEQHPKRPDFYILTVAGGIGEKIVLTNLRPFQIGEIIPVACEGFVFPDGTRLEPMKFGGVESDAKILAEWDIEYSPDKGVILPLPKGARVGECVPDAMEITQKVFVFELTPNRGDCLSVFGLARELAAVLGKPLRKNVFDVEFPEQPIDIDFKVRIKDPELCPRYSGRVIRDIVTAESPVWMKRRLTACGMRPISSIVDVTNYVMLEAGQPLHAFDLDTLEDRTIIVRRAAEGESIITIDGQERKLTTDMLVIADKRRPVAVAGVMGGMLTEITDKTKNTLLESAHFNPRNLRRTAVNLDMKSEASLRFEKGVALTNTVNASNYASYLIWKNGWGLPLSGLIDVYPRKHKPVTITVGPERIRNFISPEITSEIVEDSLTRLEFKVEKKGKNLKVTAPGHRFDVSIWEDLAEEVARLYGYERIASQLPYVKTHRAEMTDNLSKNRMLRDRLVRCGLSEIVTFSFANPAELTLIWPENAPEAVPILNPLTEDNTHLRPTLVPNMLKTVSRNKKNVGIVPMQLFELGKIFLNPAAPTETDSLVIATTGRTLSTPTSSDYKFELVGYYTIKGIVEEFIESVTSKKPAFEPANNPLYHPHRSAEIHIDGVKIGELGEVHPAVCAKFEIKDSVSLAELDLERIKPLLGEQPFYRKISRFPSVERGLTVIVPENVPAQDIEIVIRKSGTELLASANAYDRFTDEKLRSEHEKAVSLKLEFRDPERTLNSEEISSIMDKIISSIKSHVAGSRMQEKETES